MTAFVEAPELLAPFSFGLEGTLRVAMMVFWKRCFNSQSMEVKLRIRCAIRNYAPFVGMEAWTLSALPLGAVSRKPLTCFAIVPSSREADKVEMTSRRQCRPIRLLD